MTGHIHTVTLHGNTLELSGTPVAVGQPAPNAVVLDGDLMSVSISDVIAGKTAVIAGVPSLDTPVCDAETRRFNQEATTLGDSVAVVVISVDLPFSQVRWCGAAGVDHVRVLSDHRDVAFGRAWGVFLPDLRLLARAVWVVDPTGIVRYAEVVPEVSQAPQFEEVLRAVREALV